MDDIFIDMKTISLGVSEEDYEAYRQAAKAQGKPIAQLIREAMKAYRHDLLDPRSRLVELPVLLGHKSLAALPSREELCEEAFER